MGDNWSVRWSVGWLDGCFLQWKMDFAEFVGNSLFEWLIDCVGDCGLNDVDYKG